MAPVIFAPAFFRLHLWSAAEGASQKEDRRALGTAACASARPVLAADPRWTGSRAGGLPSHRAAELPDEAANYPTLLA